jgi:hypothetical protein
MSTVNKTQNSNNYNTASMNAFNQLDQMFGMNVNAGINDPYSNPFFMQQQQMNQQQQAASGAAGQQALQQRAQAMGIDQNSPMYKAQMQAMQRSQLARMAQSKNNLFLQAQNQRQQDMGWAGQFAPLQTGGAGTQSQGGLGSWLPQLAAAAISGAGKMASGGMG